MRWAISSLLLAVFLGSFSSHEARDSPPLPELPRLNISNFPPEAQQQLQQTYNAARANPNDAEANGKLGMLLEVYDRYDSAVACYQRAHLLEPGAFKWLYYLGSLQATRGKREEAAATLRAALRQNPDYLPAQLKLAESLLAAGKWEESSKIYEVTLNHHPDSPEARYGLGRAHTAQGDLRAAVESYRKACELFPTYGAAHYALAMAYRKLGQGEEARQHFNFYEQNKNVAPPMDDPLREALQTLDLGASSHLRRGVALEQVGQFEDAASEHERALELDPKLVAAHVNLIALYGRLGNYQKAEEHYRAAVALNPNQFANAHYSYGVVMMAQGKNTEAVRAFQQALQVDPYHAEAHNNLGYLLEGEGKLAEAMVEYQKAIERKPDYRQAHYNLGRALVDQELYQEGIQEFSQTLTPVDESTPTYLYALGGAYARAGDRQGALRYLHEAREQASARGQSQLLASIERALRALEGRESPQ